MLLNAETMIAVKNFCGQYDLQKFSLFEANKINKSITSLKIEVNNKLVVVKLKCSICGKYHYYTYSVSDFVKRKLIIGGCEMVGVPLFYIGNHHNVEQIVKRYNDINSKICAN